MDRIPEVDLARYKKIPIESCVKADWNYKTDEETLRNALRESIKRDGQIENIQVRMLDTGFYEVVNGNHRIDAMKDLGFRNIIAYDHGKISDAKARLLAMQTNEVRFSIDQSKYSQVLKDISQEIPLIEMSAVLAKPVEDLEDNIKLLDFDFAQYGNSDSSGSGGLGGDVDPEEWQTITLRLPQSVAEQLQAQIDRLNARLYPNEEPKNCSPVMAVEAIVQHVAQIPDERLV